MRRFGITLLLLFSSISCWANSSVQRIISLSPHTTELAFAAGLGDKLVAVSEYSDYPARAQKLEHVANYKGIKLERILALKPDLVLAWKGEIHREKWKNWRNLAFQSFTQIRLN